MAIYDGVAYEPILKLGKIIGWFAKHRVAAVSNVYVPEEIDGYPVVEIGPSAFRNDELEYISIPSSLTQIDSKAFMDCKQLKSVTIYESKKPAPIHLMVIKENAFKNCQSLKAITGTKILKLVGNGVFANCTALENVNNGIHFFGELPIATFYMCTKLKEVWIIGDKVFLADTCFYGCRNLSNIFFDCNSVILNDKCISAIKNRNIICSHKCDVLDLAYMGLNVKVKELL